MFDKENKYFVNPNMLFAEKDISQKSSDLKRPYRSELHIEQVVVVNQKFHYQGP